MSRDKSCKRSTKFESKKPVWWIILLIIPLVNIVIAIILWMAIAEARNKPNTMIPPISQSTDVAFYPDLRQARGDFWLYKLASHLHHVSPGIKFPRTKSSLSSKPRPGLSETLYFPSLITGPS